ncbi:MAG: ABC transporter permease [Planctomycetes bacterium]|nr:ABC transporter permease [Planctomycetota bacterium]
MSKIWSVALREYRVNVRSKGFLVGVILMPVFMGGGIGLQALMEKRGDTSIKTVAVIDRTGELFDSLLEAAERRNKSEIFDSKTGKQKEPTYVLVKEEATAEDAAGRRLALSDKVRDGSLFAFVEIEPSVFEHMPGPTSTDAGISRRATKLNAGGDAVSGCDIRYYSNQNTYRDLPEWLHYTIAERVKAARFAKAGLDPNVVWGALAPVSIDRLGLITRAESGEIKEAEEANIASSFLIPFFVLMLMFMLLMVGTQPLIHGVLEEKMQRISEVLLGSMRPFELMMGKLVGHTIVAMTLLAIWGLGGFALLRYNDMTHLIELRLAGWFLFFLTIAVFMYGSLFLAAGSCCNDIKETQSLIMPVMFPMIIPMMMIPLLIRDPSGQIATFFSLFPLTAPMIMTMRLAMEVPVPWWQAPVALVSCVLMTMLCVWAAGRVFRVGLLMQGKPPKLADIMKWAIRG